MPRGRGFSPGAWGAWGGGNPYPFCRNFPWLPRRWWAYQAGQTWGAGMPYPAGAPWRADAAYPTAVPSEQEVLQQQAGFLQAQLEQIQKRLDELEVAKDQDNTG